MAIAQRFNAGVGPFQINKSARTKETFFRPWRDSMRRTSHPALKRWSIFRHSIAERNLNVAGGLHHFAVGRNQTQAIHGIGDWNVLDLIVLIAEHRSEMSFVC